MLSSCTCTTCTQGRASLRRTKSVTSIYSSVVSTVLLLQQQQQQQHPLPGQNGFTSREPSPRATNFGGRRAGGPALQKFSRREIKYLSTAVLCASCLFLLYSVPPADVHRTKNISAASLGREHALWLGELAHGTELQQYDKSVKRTSLKSFFPPWDRQ